jgi:hypothetical protein
MDSWTEKQLALMKAAGNQNCLDFLSKHGVSSASNNGIKDKYDCPPAELYRQVLKARVEGRPEPTELPKPVANKTTSSDEWANRPMQGFGSAPHPKHERRRQRKRLAFGVGVGSAVAVVAGIFLKKK